jgi:hypothetical protein
VVEDGAFAIGDDPIERRLLDRGLTGRTTSR